MVTQMGNKHLTLVDSTQIARDTLFELMLKLENHVTISIESIRTVNNVYYIQNMNRIKAYIML